MVEEEVKPPQVPVVVAEPERAASPIHVVRSRSSTIDVGSALFTIDDDETLPSTELVDREVQEVVKPWKPVEDWKTGKNLLFAADAKGVKG